MEFIAQNGKRITVRQKTSICNIYVKNINFLQCDGELTTIHFVDKRQNVVVSKRLKQFEGELSDLGFIRSAHNSIVNIYQIHELINGKSRLIVMKNGETLSVSVRKLPKIKKILEKK